MADSDAQGATGDKPGSRKRARREEPIGERQLTVALGHRVRRQLLRRLEGSAGDPRSPVGLSKQLDVSVCSVSYHVDVLERCGCVASTGQRPSRRGVRRLYVSKVGDSRMARAVLEETRAADEAY